MYTIVVTSESGYIGIYNPYRPFRKKTLFSAEIPEVQEHLDIIHISQVNSVSLEAETEDKTKAKSGMFGTVNLETTSKVVGLDLIINTTDFGNPQITVPLYAGNYYTNGVPPYLLNTKGALSKEAHSMICKEYNKGKAPIDKANELNSTIEQMMNACASAAAQPQIDPTAEIVKFKSLLDSGAITQEEFDMKKRQLLGV
jgi:phosphoenolpyruvate carboxylase